MTDLVYSARQPVIIAFTILPMGVVTALESMVMRWSEMVQRKGFEGSGSGVRCWTEDMDGVGEMVDNVVDMPGEDVFSWIPFVDV